MRKLFLALVVIAATITSTRAQEFEFQIPDCKPTIASVINTLADFNLEHRPLLIGSDGEYWGLTAPNRRTIYVSDEPALAVRKQAVIHEMIHACFLEKGKPLPYDVEEQVVLQQTQSAYRDIFGVGAPVR